MIWLGNELDSESDEERTVVCTGLTMKEASKHLKDSDGRGGKPAKCCYVCKRQEGQEGAAVICTDSGTSLATPETTLYPVERRFHGSLVVFFLCFECGLLLDPEWANSGE